MERRLPKYLLTFALVFAIRLFGSTAPVAAAFKVSVGNPGLEHFDENGGVQLDFGVTDESGRPVGNLKPDNVKVFEDGKPARLLDFRGQGQGRPVDIVFVFDITESMQPYIDAVKENVIAFANDLAQNNRDYRLGLVTFEDYVVSQYPDCGCPYQNQMTSDVHEFIKWIGSLHAGGGGDIPEDQLDALAYAAKFRFRPNAQGILILISDAPDHHAGDGSENTQHDAAYWRHHQPGQEVTNLTADDVAKMLKENALTLYAIVPPPFIAPDYAKIVKETHGRSYNIVSEENRFPELVREIGHSIATEYSLVYETPRPIEDGTTRDVVLKVTYQGQTVEAYTSYRVRGVGGARINVSPEGLGAASANGGLASQLSFGWWNAAVPLLAIAALFALSRFHLGVSPQELQAILAAQESPGAGSAARAGTGGSRAPRSAPARAAPAAKPAGTPARLVTLNFEDQVPSEYILTKAEMSLGRAETNDIIIPHPSVSRTHARIRRRGEVFEITDLNSTNGTFIGEQPIGGWTAVPNGAEVRLGDVVFRLEA